jgi:methylenetetrahydrofolate--tRNA-(uracil-5-)-methyltransferase
MEHVVEVIGEAGRSECALTLARRGVRVRLYEMRPTVSSPAHATASFAELVCSNSFKSLREDSAAGLLKRELLYMGSSLMPYALASRVPAGGALAVDRTKFSDLSRTLLKSIRSSRSRHEVTTSLLSCSYRRRALCSPSLFDALAAHLGRTPCRGGRGGKPASIR